MARSLPNKLRFAVFHRDRFTCAYCGRTPPEVVLQIDHVVPASGGGGDEMENLVTSCFACNNGKSDADLNAIPQSLAESVALKKEALEQARLYNAFLIDIRREKDEAAERLGVYWCDQRRPETRGEYTVGPAWIASLKMFLDHLAEAEILGAMDVALSRQSRRSDEVAWRYFCGVCWNKIRER